MDKALISAETSPAQAPAGETKPVEAALAAMTAKAAVKEPEKKLPPVATRCVSWMLLRTVSVNNYASCTNWADSGNWCFLPASSVHSVHLIIAP